MMKLSELPTAQDVAADNLRDPDVRAEYDRTAFANTVAIKVIQYRAKHGLSQMSLAQLLGMRQPAIARLEAGDHEPTLTTLARLAHGLGIGLSIEITPDAVRFRDSA